MVGLSVDGAGKRGCSQVQDEQVDPVDVSWDRNWAAESSETNGHPMTHGSTGYNGFATLTTFSE